MYPRNIKTLFASYLRPYWRAVVALSLLNMGAGFLLSVRPLVMAPGLDVLASKDPAPAATSLSELSLNNIGSTLVEFFRLPREDVVSLAILIAILYVATTIVIGVGNQISQVLSVKTRTALQRDLFVALHRHLMKLSLGYFQRSKVGDLASKLTHDVNYTAGTLDAIVRGVLQSSAHIFVTMYILLKTDYKYALTIVVLGCLHLAITKSLGKALHRRTAATYGKIGEFTSSIFESLSAIRIIKSFASERWESSRIRALAEETRQQLVRLRTLTYLEQPVRLIADSLLVAVMLVMIFYAISTERMTLTAAALFFFLSQQLITPISELFSKLLAVEGMKGGAKRIISLLNEKEEVYDGSTLVEPLRESIEFRNASFSYGSGNFRLENLSFEIKKGEMVALIGHSGSGKSTIIDLLLRMYDVTSGSVEYDGVNIREFSQRAYRKHFGVVPQDAFLFNDTIKGNVVLDRPYSKDQLDYALDVSNSLEFVGALRDGVDSVVGDRGVLLSGGQKQRLAIARAIYGNPSILVLDEATSALDSKAELSVQEAIERIAKTTTVIVIAHRLSTILRADIIVVIDGGHVEAIGTHETLLAESSVYKDLYALQFQSSEQKQSEPLTTTTNVVN